MPELGDKSSLEQLIGRLTTKCDFIVVYDVNGLTSAEYHTKFDATEVWIPDEEADDPDILRLAILRYEDNG